MTLIPPSATPRLCAACLLRPARHGRAICVRCKKGLAPRPLPDFDPTTALPPKPMHTKLAQSPRRRHEKSAPEPTEPLPPFVPFAGHPPATLPAWADAYLVALSEMGREFVAANKAGVAVADVRGLMKIHKRFKGECAAAHGFYSDMLEMKLALTTQVAGPIVVMKRRRPKRFLEPALIQQTIVNNSVIAVPPQAEALMKDWMKSIDTRRAKMLRGEIIDVPADVIVESTEGVPA